MHSNPSSRVPGSGQMLISLLTACLHRNLFDDIHERRLEVIVIRVDEGHRAGRRLLRFGGHGDGGLSGMSGGVGLRRVKRAAAEKSERRLAVRDRVSGGE